MLSTHNVGYVLQRINDVLPNSDNWKLISSGIPHFLDNSDRLIEQAGLGPCQTCAVSHLGEVLAGLVPPSSFVMSPRCSMCGKWRLVMEIGAFSISLAQRGTIPCRLATRGNTPIPSKRLPRVRGPAIRVSR